MTVPVSPSAGDGYASLLAGLKERIRAARLKAAVAVNQELILLYWSIGRDILARQDTEGWGARIVDRLAADLRRDFPEMTGLSPRNLKYMRSFAEAFPAPRDRATGCCTIAVGPRHQAGRSGQEPR